MTDQSIVMQLLNTLHCYMTAAETKSFIVVIVSSDSVINSLMLVMTYWFYLLNIFIQESFNVKTIVYWIVMNAFINYCLYDIKFVENKTWIVVQWFKCRTNWILLSTNEPHFYTLYNGLVLLSLIAFNWPLNQKKLNIQTHHRVLVIQKWIAANSIFVIAHNCEKTQKVSFLPFI